VETGDTKAIFTTPAHPYTAGLIAATPTEASSLADLHPIPGGLPDLRGDLPPCRFIGRCTRKTAICETAPLPVAQIGPGHVAACHHPARAAAEKERAIA